jgi:hypothetical protein
MTGANFRFYKRLYGGIVVRNGQQGIGFRMVTFALFCGIIEVMNEYTIVITFDEEAAVWYAINDDIPIAFESDSLDVLIERVKLAVPELLELNGKNHEHTVLHFTMKREAVLV